MTWLTRWLILCGLGLIWVIGWWLGGVLVELWLRIR